MSDRHKNNDKDQDEDPRGEYGGDTGNTDQLGKGEQAEKGDQRRDNPVHSGPTRSGPGGRESQNSEN